MGRVLDLAGKRFGHLTAIERISGTKTQKSKWLCRCDCGELHEVDTGNLTRGMVKSCGHCSRRKYDYTGQRFGKLTAVFPCKDENERIGWWCKCDCGSELFVETGAITASLNKEGRHYRASCGCAHKDHVTHGASYTRLYSVWVHMKRRCYDMNDINYKHYGARGIRMCEEWRNDFSTFRAWALLNGFNENLKWSECTIDRIDVNGNYEPDNCRWVNMHAQLLNRRAARLP